MAATKIKPPKTLRQWVIWIVVAIILFFILRWAFRKLGRFFYTPHFESMIVGGGEVDPNWSAKGYTDAMWNAVDSWWGWFSIEDKENAARDISQLNDNEKIAVWNDWQNRYYNKDGQTIEEAMLGERTVPVLVFGEPNYWENVLADWNRLNLS